MLVGFFFGYSLVLFVVSFVGAGICLEGNGTGSKLMFHSFASTQEIAPCFALGCLTLL